MQALEADNHNPYQCHFSYYLAKSSLVYMTGQCNDSMWEHTIEQRSMSKLYFEVAFIYYQCIWK